MICSAMQRFFMPVVSFTEGQLSHFTQDCGLKLVNFAGLPDAYKALADRRCDGIALDEGVIKMRMMPDPARAAENRIAAEPYERLPQSGGVRKGDDTFREAVNAAVRKAAAEGKLIEWERAYGMPASDYVAQLSNGGREKEGI
jgi:polar amino acid transport system substrate-binding protein